MINSWKQKAKQLKSASLFWRVTLYCRPFVKPMACKNSVGDANGVTCLFDKDYFGRKMGDEEHNHVRREIAT
jgi:hypothetical protein